MRVEIGAVDAGEFHRVADLHPATSTHSGAVDHHRIQAYSRPDLEWACHFCAGPHHDRRTDRDDFVDIRVPSNRLLEPVGDQSHDASGPVVGADDDFVTYRAEAILPENEVAVAETNDTGYGCAVARVRAGLREDRRDTQATADADDPSCFADVARDAHRTGYGVQPGSDSAITLHFAGRLAHRLDH